MSEQRQKNRPEQEVLAFPVESRSDAPTTAVKGTETLRAKRKTESLAGSERLMEEVCELENCKQALQRVKANKGSPGVDGMTVEELPEYLKQHGPEIGEQLRNGTYQPQPVRRVEIPKPDGNGVRKLGIAGSAEALGPNVLRTQPRFPTGAQRSASGAPGAAVHRRRAPLGG
jgi:RNA-directed DNA polymerase